MIIDGLQWVEMLLFEYDGKACFFWTNVDRYRQAKALKNSLYDVFVNYRGYGVIASLGEWSDFDTAIPTIKAIIDQRIEIGDFERIRLD